MVNPKELRKIKQQLRRVVPDAESSARLDSAKSENDLRGLLNKYTRLVVELEYRGGKEFDDALRGLTMVRKLLSDRFKAERQELINMHWKAVKKKNKEFAEDMREDLQEFREDLREDFEESSEDAAEAAALLELENLEQDWREAQSELAMADETLEVEKKMAFDDPSLDEMQKQLDGDLSKASRGLDQRPIPQVPVPSIRDCVKKVMEAPGPDKNRKEFDDALRLEVAASFARMRAGLRAAQIEDTESRVGMVDAAEKKFMLGLAGSAGLATFGPKLDNVLNLKKKKSGLEAKTGDLRRNIKDFVRGDLAKTRVMFAGLMAKAKEMLSLEGDDSDMDMEKRTAPTPFDKLKKPSPLDDD